MTQQRSVTDKIADALRAYETFRSELTDDALRQWRETMTGAQNAVAAAGDMKAYADMVQLSLQVQRVISSNDRAAMIAAVMATQSGVARPVIDTEGE